MITKKIAYFIIEHRVMVLIFSFIMSIFLIYYATRLKILTDLDDLAPQGHPYIQLDNKMNDIFGGHSLTLIGIEVKQGDLFNIHTLNKIHRITRKILASKYIVPSSVVSIAGRRLKNIESNAAGDYIEITDFEKMVFNIRKEPAYMEKFKEAVFTNNMIYGPLVSKDKKATLILAEWKAEKYYPYIFKRLREIAAEEKDENHKILLAGRPIILGYIDAYTQKVFYIMILTCVLLLSILFFFFRTIRGMLFPFTGPLMGVIWSLGLMGLFGLRIDSLGILVPFLILSVGISHAVQVAKRYDEEFPESEDNRASCEAALAKLMIPALGAILTDMAGFAALTVIPLRMVQSMAVIAAFGMASLFFTVFLLHPVLLSVMHPPKKEAIKRGETATLFLEKFMTKLACFTYDKSRRVVFLGVFLLIIVGIIGYKKLQIGGQQLAFWSDSPLVQDQIALQQHFQTGIFPLYLFVDGGEEENSLINRPFILRKMSELQRYLEKRPEVGKASSIIDIVKRMNRAFHADDPRYDRFPDNDKWVGEYMYVYFLGTEAGETDSQIDYYNKYTNIQVLVNSTEGNIIKNLVQDTEEWIKRNLAKRDENSPGTIEAAAGFIGILRAVDQELAKAQIANLTVISLAIIIFAAIIYRSIWAGIFVFIPLLLANLLTHAIMGYMGIALYTSTIPVASLGMGLGVDYSLYLISRLKEELNIKSQNERKVFQRAFGTSGKAILFTVLAVTVGVMTWYLSDLKFQADMGILLGFIVIFNMLGAFFLLPSLIAEFRPRFIFGRE